jgi:hypothetical protein
MRRTFIKFLLLAPAAASLASCASLAQALESFTTSRLRIGMSKTEAEKAMGLKPDSTVAAKRDPETNKIIEVVQYSGYVDTNQKAIYWLYFVNDQLDRWEPANKYGPQI